MNHSCTPLARLAPLAAVLLNVASVQVVKIRQHTRTPGQLPVPRSTGVPPMSPRRQRISDQDHVTVPTSAIAKELNVLGSIESIEVQTVTPPTMLIERRGIGSNSHLGRFMLKREDGVFLPTFFGDGTKGNRPPFPGVCIRLARVAASDLTPAVVAGGEKFPHRIVPRLARGFPCRAKAPI